MVDIFKLTQNSPLTEEFMLYLDSLDDCSDLDEDEIKNEFYQFVRDYMNDIADSDTES